MKFLTISASVLSLLLTAAVAPTALAKGDTSQQQQQDQAKDLPNPPEDYTMHLIRIAEGNTVYSLHPYHIAENLSLGGLVGMAGYYSSNANYTRVPQLQKANGAGRSSSDLYLQNANMLLDAQLGFARTHLNVAYEGMPTLGEEEPYAITHENTLDLKEAYVLLANFQESPFYVKAGKGYGFYGDYDPNEIILDLTTIMTEFNSVGAEAGAVMANGLYGKVGIYPTQRPLSAPGNARNSINNYSFKVGFDGKVNDQFELKANFGYLNDIRGLTYINSSNYQSVVGILQPIVLQKSSGLAAEVGAASGAFDVDVRYARFNNNKSVSYHSPTGGYITRGLNNPSALGIDGGITFTALERKSTFKLGFQRTYAAAALFLPRTRYFTSLRMGINRYISAEAAYYNDNNYDANETAVFPTNGVSHNNTFIGSLLVNV